MYNKIFAKLEVCACGVKPQITVDRKNSRFSVVCNSCQYEARAESVDIAAELWNRAISVPSKSDLEIRYNQNHDPKTGRFTGKGGAGGLTDSSAGDIIKAEIEKGNIKLEINHEKQARHIKGTPEYKEGRSYLTVSENEAQDIVNNKYGTGKIIYNKNGKPAKEKINCNQIIGVDIDQITKNETLTDKGTIHYSNTGTHLVPRKENKNGKA